MGDMHVPNLTFPTVRYSRTETPWDLRPLLYRGGAAASIRKVAQLISEGKLGRAIEQRLPLVEKLHEAIVGRLAGGGSRYTARTAIVSIRSLYAWADKEGLSPTISSIESCFISWTDYLLHRQRVVGDLSSLSSYGLANVTSSILEEALNLNVRLLHKTRITNKRTKKLVLGTQADKKNLADTFAFGRALLDISEALTAEAIRGRLPVHVRFRSGHVIEEWSGLVPPQKLKTLNCTTAPLHRKKQIIRKRAAREDDTSLRTRSSLANLRIEAELLIFIAQTGMNLAQAFKLRVSKFSYQSHLDGYQVRRIYKGRRRGEVEFEIYSEYRALFERYLAWRQAIFPTDKDGLLFPLCSSQGRSADVAPACNSLKKRMALLGIPFFGAQALRKTRVNWLMRRSRDPALAAEMSQHTEEVLFSQYNKPHHQAAIVEISRFLAASDPAISPPGPGACVEAAPEPVPDIPTEAPRPDCISPAGCLFCTHQRDIDSEDHTWSLASYRYYKSLELVRYRPSVGSRSQLPAEAVVDRLTSKLKHILASSDVRALWVKESLARVEEEDFHPKWDGFIRLAECRA